MLNTQGKETDRIIEERSLDESPTEVNHAMSGRRTPDKLHIVNRRQQSMPLDDQLTYSPDIK